MGAGWVGLVTATGFAALGHDVFVRDIDPERIDDLREGRVRIHERGIAELLERHRERLHFTLDPRVVFDSAQFVFVCVGTPATRSGDADLSAVWNLIGDIPPGMRTTLIMKSTVPVGTGARVRLELDATNRSDVLYVSNPEFLAEGSAVHDFQHPSRVVIGTFDGDGGEAVARLYEPLRAPVRQTDVASAEMIKYASNAFLATKISFINEIANVCEETGADVTVVADGMGLDARIGPHFLRAGVGYGGSCFPKDVAALKQLAGNSGYHFELLNAVIEVNELQKRRLLTKLLWHLGSLRGKTIVLLGLAFKPHTNDLREAPSLVLAARLIAEGARVRAWDAVALDDASAVLGDGVELCGDPLSAVRDADAAVVLTEWPELATLSLDEVRRVMRTPLIVDGRNFLDPDAVQAAGLAYEGIGRPGRVRQAGPVLPGDPTQGARSTRRYVLA